MRTKLFLHLVAVSMLTASAAAQTQQAEAQNGQLRLYDYATQIGTVANREFKDARGRVVKIIYYSGGGDSLKGPFREELLREQSIETYVYDEKGCRTRSKKYAPGMKLLREFEVRCRLGTATPELSTTFDASGKRLSTTMHKENGGTRTSVFFGDDGERVVAIDGETPGKLDLVNGWGEMVGGFHVGIAMGRDRGPQREMRVWATIKNVAHAEEGVVIVAPLELELRDAGGKFFKPKSEWLFEQPGPLPGQCPALGKTGRGAPSVGRYDHLYSYDLAEHFPTLMPGKYSLTLKHCLSTTHLPLISNTISFEIE